MLKYLPFLPNYYNIHNKGTRPTRMKLLQWFLKLKKKSPKFHIFSFSVTKALKGCYWFWEYAQRWCWASPFRIRLCWHDLFLWQLSFFFNGSFAFFSLPLRIVKRFEIFAGISIVFLFFCFLSDNGLAFWFGSILLERSNWNEVSWRFSFALWWDWWFWQEDLRSRQSKFSSKMWNSLIIQYRNNWFWRGLI